MKLEELNVLPPEKAREEFARCCGASRWVQAMTLSRPFAGRSQVFDAADQAWSFAGEKDWLEAFAHLSRSGG